MRKLTLGFVMKKQLIQKLDEITPGHLGDEYMAIAYTIEQSLVSAGAVPGEDYTLLDLYRLAQPFALELFRDESKHMQYDFPH